MHAAFELVESRQASFGSCVSWTIASKVVANVGHASFSEKDKPKPRSVSKKEITSEPWSIILHSSDRPRVRIISVERLKYI